MKDILTCISIFGRPYYTARTLNSLYNSVVSDRLFLHIFFTETPELTQSELMTMMQAYTGSYILHNCSQDGGNFAARLAFSVMQFEYLNKPNYWKWFLFIENDIEFDPNWFDKAHILRDVSKDELNSRLKRLGFISLNNFNLSFYNSIYINSNAFPFYIKEWTSSQAYLFSPELINYIPLTLDQWLGRFGWDRTICSNLTKQGFAHIVPASSIVKHIAPVTGLQGVESC